MNRSLRTACLAAVGSLVVAGCDRAPTHPEVAPVFTAVSNQSVTVVTTWAEWAAAIQNALPGAKIAIEGTIEIAPGQEVYLTVPGVTILAASPGSGLRGVAGVPDCLVCLDPRADGATVKGLILDGVAFAPLQPGLGPGDPLENATIKDNHVVCDGNNGCQVHVFLWNAPKAEFNSNVLTGEPAFSAIQIQESSNEVVVKNNWVEHGGPLGGIRIRFSNGSAVRDNTIASAPRWGIRINGVGSTFTGNKILEITNVGEPSCADFSIGSGTAGTANTWKDNIAPVPSDPVGICVPIP